MCKSPPSTLLFIESFLLVFSAVYFPVNNMVILGFLHCQLDRAAKKKSTPEAEKYYSETVSALNDLFAKLG